jgi:hypothetical protein
VAPGEQTALFLLTDMSSGMTGEVLYVDAGYRIIGVWSGGSLTSPEWPSPPALLGEHALS